MCAMHALSRLRFLVLYSRLCRPPTFLLYSYRICRSVVSGNSVYHLCRRPRAHTHSLLYISERLTLRIELSLSMLFLCCTYFVSPNTERTRTSCTMIRTILARSLRFSLLPLLVVCGCSRGEKCASRREIFNADPSFQPFICDMDNRKRYEVTRLYRYF